MSSENRILIIDDNVDLTQIINMVLTAEGFSVRVCNDMEEGSFCFYDWKPRVLLLDVNINGEDTRKFCQKIKTEKGDEVIVILISGDESTLEYNDTYRADDFIAKPFDSDVLIQIVSSHFSQKA